MEGYRRKPRKEILSVEKCRVQDRSKRKDRNKGTTTIIALRNKAKEEEH